MSSARHPEFFFDRSLGNASARRLRDEGWVVHLTADYHQADATDIADERWIAEGARRGRILQTKDEKIRYRAHEFEALRGGQLRRTVEGS